MFFVFANFELSSWNVVFSTNPTLITPILGTPQSGDLSNCTFPTLNQDTTGSAATLTTSRTIGGVSFDGSSDIDLHGVNTTTTIIYCDANRSDSYTEDGTLSYPYKSLSDAITAKCGDNDTDTIVFYLASGSYTGTISKTKASVNQEIYIIGENKDSVKIQGDSSWSTSTSNVLFLRNFKKISIENITIQYGAYGFYPRDCTSVSIINCLFFNCGSSGDTTMHDGSGSAIQQAKYKWSSGDALASNTSNGGAMRVRNCHDIEIRNNRVEYCFRGYRIQCH